ncbi:MAG: RNA polymerase sigma factor [Terriglobales bacterium]
MSAVVPINMLVASDDDLMAQVQSGQALALSTLFERHQGALLNYFLRLGTTRALAEDFVQDVFVRILKYRASYRPGSRFATWMYYIARNVRLDGLHKRRGEVGWEEEYAPSFEPADAAQSEQEHRLLRQALERLPREKREVLVMSRYQDLKHDEIGAILGCAAGTVKVRVHRAMLELREHYELLAAGGA